MQLHRYKTLSALLLVVWFASLSQARKPDGQLQLKIVDSESGQAIPAQIELRRSNERPVPTRGWAKAPLGDHAYIDGTAILGLRRGQYLFDLDAGPEYRTQSGHFEIQRDADDSKPIKVNRFANLAEEGWLAADLTSSRPTRDIDLLCRASQVAYAPRISYTWKKDAWVPLGKPIERTNPDESVSAHALWADQQGAAWLIDPSGQLSVKDLPKPEGSSVKFLASARERGFRTVASITSLELPLWLAHDCLDGVMVIDDWADSKAGAKWLGQSKLSREPHFQQKDGVGRWREHIYYQLLNAGIRITPLAGTGSGLNDTSFGQSRVYVYSDDTSSEAWWEAAEQGAVVTTNGPLLRPRIGGKAPGQTFRFSDGQQIEILISLNLATRQRIEYLEVIKNGQAAMVVRLSDWAESGGKLPPITFQESGWLLVRAVTQNQERYQLAMSGPSFVESSAGPYINLEARQFFIDWLNETARRFRPDNIDEYTKAKLFWQSQP